MSTQQFSSDPAQPSATPSYSKPANSGSFVRIVLLAGLLAGTLDALSASLYYLIQGNKNPEKIFIYIASVAFGKSVLLTGGNGMAVVGLLIHFFIAYSFTLLFFLLYPRLPLLSKNRVLTAIGYGLFVWVIMNLIVCPIAGRAYHFRPENTIINIIILMIAIGIPVSFIANSYFRKR